MQRRQIRRELWILAATGLIACASGVFFYFMQYHLTVSLWDSFKQMEQRADEWRQAFIDKNKWQY